MTAVKPPSAYRSGLCTHGRHDGCRGAWGAAVCDCTCHQEPEPEPELAGLRIGSLFSGYGGLEQGVQAVLGGSVAWHSEHEPPTTKNPRPTQAAARVLAHRFPGVPNHGDITAVDWSTVEPVDVLVGGFPCQDVSAAGLRRGIHPDTRSGLWSQFAYAINQLRPSLVVIENVRGLLYADAHHPAHGQLGTCPWCVGDVAQRPLRALGAVLGDLADIGFHAEWVGLPASDVGAPHERFRVFVVAWPAQDAHGPAGRERRFAAPEPTQGRGARPDAGRRGRAPAADSHGVALREQPVALTGRGGEAFAGLAGAHPAADPHRHRVMGGEGGRHAVRADERVHPDRRRPDAPAHTDSSGQRPDLDGLRAGEPHTDWGAYEPAVRRWERLTRPAPAPTEPTTRGGRRLSPAFVEWMQGLPAGWVTAVPGVSRKEALRVLGNGVVPQQAAAALRLLLPDVIGAAA